MTSRGPLQDALKRISDPLTLLEGIFADAPVAFQVYARDGRSLLTNPAYARLFGEGPRPDHDALPAAVAEQTLRGETVRARPFWHARESGTRIAIEPTYFPLLDPREQVTHVVAVYQDVTAERAGLERAEAERDILSAIIEQSGNGIIVADAAGVLQIFNPEAERQHGVSFKEVAAPDWAPAYGLLTMDGQPLPLEQTPLYLALQGHRVAHARWRVRRPDGTLRTLSGTAAPVRTGEGTPAGAVLITRDETELIRDEEYMRFQATVLENVQESIIVTDLSGRIVQWNRGATDIFGYSAEEMIGRTPDILYPAAENHALRKDLTEIADGRDFSGEWLGQRKDGSRVWVDIKTSLMHDAERRPIGFIGVGKDVTERRIAEQRLAMESRINETLHRVGVAFAKELDRQRLIQLVTDEATALTGAELGAFFFVESEGASTADHGCAVAGAASARVAALPLDELRPLLAASIHEQDVIRLKDIRSDPRFSGLAIVSRGELPLVSYLAVPVILASGEALGVLFFGAPTVGFFTAQHERIVVGLAAQAAIALHNSRLLESSRKSQDEAEAANRAKDEFLAMLGHELRNPLAPIMTALEIMKLRGEGPTTKEQHVIERQVHHLTGLVDDLLDISKITRGKVQLKRVPLNLADVAAKAVEIASPLFEQRRHHLTISMPAEKIRLEADELRLSQIIANLLTNAAKYTEPGGHIALSARRHGSEVEIRVKDDGIGIAPDLLPRVFDLFVQGRRSSDRGEGGLGLGLALVKSLVHMHQGQVFAASEGPGHGSEFVIRLPALTETAPEQSAGKSRNEAPSLGGRTGKRVLVVDDNIDAAELLGEILSTLGHQVSIAHDGPRALELIERFHPDVALLDIGLPVMDGYELAAKLRQRLAPHPPRLMAITGYGQEHDRTRSDSAGFERHFVKPVRMEKLIEAISSPAPEHESP